MCAPSKFRATRPITCRSVQLGRDLLRNALRLTAFPRQDPGGNLRGPSLLPGAGAARLVDALSTPDQSPARERSKGPIPLRRAISRGVRWRRRGEAEEGCGALKGP